ncbi:MAG TPA: hypothetical protein VFT49_03200 [Candidatus Saccharimonadales bacterium]|nr:hypothetical protein [Candidatus Saccharimonadales bacterium]
MKLTKKNVLKILIASFAATLVIEIASVLSIWNVYNCPIGSDTNCSALNSASTKVTIGSTLATISWTIFIISAVVYLWLVIKKRT